MRLTPFIAVMLVVAPALGWAQDEDDDLAPIVPTAPKPKTTVKPKKKPAAPATKPAEPMELPSIDPGPTPSPSRPNDPPPVAPAASATPTPSPQFEDPDLSAAARVNRSGPRLITTLGWVGAGVGGAVVVTGAVLAGLASGARAGLQLSSLGVVPADQAAQASSTVRLSRTSSVLFVVGGLVAASGLVLALWPEPADSTKAVRLVPSVGPHSAALMVEGVWQ
jgi:hypothetical protein